MPAEIISLNQFRKARRQADKESQSAENRVRFGRSKSERKDSDARSKRVATDMDGKQLERDPADDSAR